MAKVKICGITNLEDALLAQELGADFLGFILYPKSKRYIELEDALKIKKHLKIPTVAVIVNEPIEKVKELLNHFDFVQLHGDEDCAFSISNRIIKVFRVKDALPNIEKCWDENILLFDTLSNQYGGTGKSFDWNILKPLKRDFFVSGGLNEENLENLKDIKPYAVDVASGVETKPGKKDPYKLENFIKRAKKL
ncbi:phosphoribosylanthranilate isomerase [Hydrogenobaculum acidophilum]